MTNRQSRINEVEADVQERLAELRQQAEKLTAKVGDMMGEYKFDFTNAKLYDVSCELYRGTFGDLTDDERIHAFNFFCEDEWRIFDEYLSEKDVEIEHLGRTSSFYIVPKNRGDNEMIEPFYDNRNIEWTEYDVIELINERYVGLWLEDVIEMLVGGCFTTAREFYDGWAKDRTHEESYESFLLGGEYDNIEDHLDEIQELMDEVEDNIPNLTEVLEQVSEVYAFIDEYKANQVEYFKQWMDEFYRPDYLEDGEIA